MATTDESTASEKERLSNCEFTELIPHLSLRDLLLIEYYIDQWQPMLLLENAKNRRYRCNLCGIYQYGAKNVTLHIDGRRHQGHMKTVKQLYHPNYTYDKQSFNETTVSAKPTAAPSAGAAPEAPVNKATAATVATPPNARPAGQAKKPNAAPVPIKKPNAQNVATKASASTAMAAAPTKPPMSLKPNLGAAQIKAAAAAAQQGNKAKLAIAAKPATAVKAAINSGAPTAATKTSPAPVKKPNDTAAKVQCGAAGKEASPAQANATATNANRTDLGDAEVANIMKEAVVKPRITVRRLESLTGVKAEESVTTNQAETDATKPTAGAVIVDETATVAASVIAPSKDTAAAPDKATAAIALKNFTIPKKPPTVAAATGAKTQTAATISKHATAPLKSAAAAAARPAAAISKAVAAAAPKPMAAHSRPAAAAGPKPTAAISKPATAAATAKPTAATARQNNGIATAAVATIESPPKKTPQKAAPATAQYNALKEAGTKANAAASGLAAKLVKNPYARMSSERTISEKIAAEVIVLDDEELTHKQTGKRATNLTVINISSTEGENSDGGKSPPAKKAKFVSNPAAAVVERETTATVAAATATVAAEKELPVTHRSANHTTSNIVIIPSKQRDKGKDKPLNSNEMPVVSTSKTGGRSEPKFSHKTFSCRPSDNDIQGLVGVEYVIKILKKKDDQNPRYECGLCELILDGFAMQNHLLGYNHRLKFCEKHFPSAMRQYRLFMDKVPEHEIYKVMTPVLDKLAIAIEEYHGRDLPYECYEREFSMNRHDVLTKVFSVRHATEQYGPSFTHVVDSKEVDRLIAERHNYTCKPQQARRTAMFDALAHGNQNTGSNRNRRPTRSPQHNYQDIGNNSIEGLNIELAAPSMPMYPGQYPTQPQWATPLQPTGYVPIDDETHKMMVENFLRETKRSSRDQHTRSSHGSKARTRTPTRTTIRHKSISPLRDNDIWQAYRHMVDQKIIELDNLFQQYRNDPESHPMYNEEWLKFWKRRKDELIVAGLDHRTYNYQLEWVRFVNVRIEELYTEDVENMKIHSRERLCLPLSNDEVPDPKYHVQATAPPPPITIRPSIQVDEEPIVEEPPAPSSVVVIRATAREINLDDGKSTKVVAVLRLMTALEDQLGSLGPKIIDLLAKALQLEKMQPQNINSIILTVENCFLLETAMEKFKGLVIAGLLEGSKERALRKVVTEVESLLDVAEAERANQPAAAAHDSPAVATLRPEPAVVAPKRKSNDAASTSNAPPPAKRQTMASPRLVDQLESADKKDLAAKLAAALSAQGKTDYDPEHLEHLITVYTLLEKKKRETAAKLNVTAASVSGSNVNATQRSLSETLADLQRSQIDDSIPSNNNNKHDNDRAMNNDGRDRATNMTTSNTILSASTASNAMSAGSTAPNAMNRMNGSSDPWQPNQNYFGNQNTGMYPSGSYGQMEFNNFMPNAWSIYPQNMMHFNPAMGFANNMGVAGFNPGYNTNAPAAAAYNAAMSGRGNFFNSNHTASNNNNNSNANTYNNNANNTNMNALSQRQQVAGGNFPQHQQQQQQQQQRLQQQQQQQQPQRAQQLPQSMNHPNHNHPHWMSRDRHISNNNANNNWQSAGNKTNNSGVTPSKDNPSASTWRRF